jgi:hypothetical protein
LKTVPNTTAKPTASQLYKNREEEKKRETQTYFATYLLEVGEID